MDLYTIYVFIMYDLFGDLETYIIHYTYYIPVIHRVFSRAYVIEYRVKAERLWHDICKTGIANSAIGIIKSKKNEK